MMLPDSPDTASKQRAGDRHKTRTSQVMVRVSPAEARVLKLAARFAGGTVAGRMRDLALAEARRQLRVLLDSEGHAAPVRGGPDAHR
jgi:hypothetical protein